MKYTLPLLAALGLNLFNNAHALEVDMRGSAGVEVRLFGEDPAYAGQERDSVSLALSPEFYYAIPDSNDAISFALHARIDSADEERSHADIRELNYLKVGDSWELRAGLGKVFWGVTEGQHLVDIVNQTDAVENIDGEDKLGQPMLNLTLLSFQDYGILDIFVLPGFRERSFAGSDGRLRGAMAINTDAASYEARNNEQHVDAALRWSHSIGLFDIGLSHFWGTSRDPLINPTFVVDPVTGAPVITGLTPHYPIINQTGLDLQASLEGWLLKLELISRAGRIKANNNPAAPAFKQQRYTALATGFEYTIVDFAETGVDLGLLAEWNFDDRDKRATSTFQNDLLIGTRWAFNDAESSEFLAGLVQDLDYSTTSLNLEGSTRLSDHVKISLEGRWFLSTDKQDSMMRQLRDDSFIQAQLDYFF